MTNRHSGPEHGGQERDDLMGNAAATEVVSLRGEAGSKVARDISALMAGRTTIDKVGRGYYIASSGAIGIRVDEETFSSLPGPSL